MNLYDQTLYSLENGTFASHVKNLKEIQVETNDEELVSKIEDLINSLGSINDFTRQHDACSNFCIKEDHSDSAEKLIEFCKKKAK